MVRPRKCRMVEAEPGTTYFKPRAIPLMQLEEVCLGVDEMESLKLKFIEKMEQEDAAKKMGVSRTTFWRIFSSAGEKVSDAIINGKAIKIEGGDYKIHKIRG